MGTTRYEKIIGHDSDHRYFEFDFEDHPIDSIHGVFESAEDSSGMIIEITPRSDAEKSMLHEILANDCFTIVDDGDGCLSCLIGSATEAYNLAKALQRHEFLPKDPEFLIDFTSHAKATGKLPVEMPEHLGGEINFDEEDDEIAPHHTEQLPEGIHISSGADVMAPIENYAIPFTSIPQKDVDAIEFACVPLFEALRPPRRPKDPSVRRQ